MKEKIKNFLIGEKNSIICLWIFLMLSFLFFLATLLQFFGIELNDSTSGSIFGRIIDMLVMTFLFLVPLSFFALFSGIILGNRDRRHVLLTVILGIMMATAILGNVLVARMSSII